MTLSPKTIGIILAAGKGTRLHSTDTNKTALEAGGKPLVCYGVELFAQTMDAVLVVVGAYAASVRTALKNYDVLYAVQDTPNGTGHAAQVAIDNLKKRALHPAQVCIGYGDHLMFYTPAHIEAILKTHGDTKAAVTLVSVEHHTPDELGWGRVLRAANGDVEAIVEQKDATPTERAITEQNAGFYCCDYAFLTEALTKLTPSPVTGELYLTDIVMIARKKNLRVVAHPIPFEQVGTGVNTPEQLAATKEILAPKK